MKLLQTAKLLKYIFIILNSLVWVQIIQAQTFSTNVNQTLLEGSNQTFFIVTNGLPVTQDNNYGLFEVTVNLNHNQTNNIELELESPAGTLIKLSKNNGNGSNFTNTKFRLYASQSIRFANSPFNKSYMPYDNMRNLYDGQNPNGVWKLHYIDNVINGIVGTLSNWQMQFNGNPMQQSLDSANSSIPILKINTAIGYIPNEPKTPGTIKVYDNGWNQPNSFSAPVPNFEIHVGIEKQGYTSSGGDKPNYDFEIQTFNGNDSAMSLFGLPSESDFILKSCYTDEFMMKDPLTFAMSNRMGFYAPRTRYVELVVNGEYSGLYILMEKIKRDSNRVNIAKLNPTDTSGSALTGGYIFEINPNGAPAAWYSNYQGYQGTNLGGNIEFKMVYPKLNIIHPTQLNYINNFVDSFENVLYGNNFQDPLYGWRKYANENSIIDFLIVSEYSTNYDTYGRSNYLFKEKSTDGNKIHFAPPWDSDRGYVYDTNWVHLKTHGYWEFPFWWSKLRTDSLFEKRLQCRYATYRNEALTDSSFANFIDTTYLYMRNSLQRNVARWQNYWAEPTELKNIALFRLDWMDQKLSSNVIFPPLPLTQTQLCSGTPINIFLGNQYTYNFSPGPDTSYFPSPAIGDYTAKVKSIYGCETAQHFNVLQQPNTSITGLNIVCNNSQFTYIAPNIPFTTYQWTINGGTAVNGCTSTSNTCSVLWGNSGSGSLLIKQSSSTTCFDMDTLAVQIKLCTSISETNFANQFKIFPNPCTDAIYIEPFNNIGFEKEIDVVVLNIEGRIIQQEKFNLAEQQVITIHSANWMKGIYFIKIELPNHTSVHKKIIKE